MSATEPFLISDDDRYSRFQLIAWWDQQKIAAARILVVGAGALGNEVLKNLALLGVGTIDVIDMDQIESSNLSRSVLFREKDAGRSKAEVAAAAARELNPDVSINPIHGNVITGLGLGLFRDVDVVIGCLDNREARLWVNRCCWKVGTPWIDGGIQEINGVAKVFVPPHGSCYECAMTETDYRLIQLRYSCPLLSREDIQSGKVPTAPTIASIIGGLQTQEALKLIHEMPSAESSALVFNGVANQFYQTRYPRRENCLSHEVYEPIEEVPVSASQTAAELLAYVAEHESQLLVNREPVEGTSEPVADQTDGQGDCVWALELDRDLLLELHCGACDLKKNVGRPVQSVSMDEAGCPQCGQTMRPETTCLVEDGSPLSQRTMSELSVPAYDVVRVTRGDTVLFLLLAEDEAQVKKETRLDKAAGQGEAD